MQALRLFIGGLPVERRAWFAEAEAMLRPEASSIAKAT